MNYWKNVTTNEIVQADECPGPSWVEILCSCVFWPGDDDKCPVHGEQS